MCRKHTGLHETEGYEMASFDTMRFAALVLLVASTCGLGAASGPDPGSDVQHTNIRKELLSEYKYGVPPKGQTIPDPIVADSSAAPQILPLTPPNSDVVRMEPFTVREGAKLEALHADIVRQRANARTEAITSKLGIGVHVAPVGPVGFYAVTVFYIPISVGFGFSF
jgi:hypothetical protein